MTNTSLVVDKSVEGEVIPEDFSCSISIDCLQSLIERMPETSYLRIYNDKIFEEFCHIIKVNGSWYFWEDHKCTLHTWDWKKDMEAIFKTENDPDEIQEMNEGWELYSTEGWEMGAEKELETLVPDGVVPVKMSRHEALGYEDKDSLLLKYISQKILNHQFDSMTNAEAEDILAEVKKVYNLS